VGTSLCHGPDIRAPHHPTQWRELRQVIVDPLLGMTRWRLYWRRAPCYFRHICHLSPAIWIFWWTELYSV
jgi:hypothetical protein